MRKIIITLAVLITAVVLLLSLRRSDSSTASPLIGHTFTMKFYDDDPRMADYMNQFGFSVEFVNDSTYIRRSRSKAETYHWHIFDDSISLGERDNYLLVGTGQSLFLTNEQSKIELLPIR